MELDLVVAPEEMAAFFVGCSLFVVVFECW